MINPPGRGGRKEFSRSHGIHIYVYVVGCYFAKIGISMGGYKLHSNAPKLPKFDVFGANFHKQHPISAKFGAFF